MESLLLKPWRKKSTLNGSSQIYTKDNGPVSNEIGPLNAITLMITPIDSIHYQNCDGSTLTS